MGFTNIKIYNGGLKDWKKSGFELASIEPLPEYNGSFITAEELMEEISTSESKNCMDSKGRPILTILDFRTENFLKTEHAVPCVKTGCRTIKCLLDDLKDPDVRRKIPKNSRVVCISETGNRDMVVMRYLSKYGYRNIVGLRFGMRAWIKADYPVTYGD